MRKKVFEVFTHQHDTPCFWLIFPDNQKRLSNPKIPRKLKYSGQLLFRQLVLAHETRLTKNEKTFPETQSSENEIITGSCQLLGALSMHQYMLREHERRWRADEHGLYA